MKSQINLTSITHMFNMSLFLSCAVRMKTKPKSEASVWHMWWCTSRKVGGQGWGVQLRGSGQENRGWNELRQSLLSVVSLRYDLATCQARFAACQAAAGLRTGEGFKQMRDWERGWTRVCRLVSGFGEAVNEIRGHMNGPHSIELTVWVMYRTIYY